MTITMDRLQLTLDQRLDYLLCIWHQHRANYRQTRGFSGQDATSRDYRAPCHYDWANGAADARADDLEVAAVTEAMDKIPNEPRRWHTALAFLARNLVTGAEVWTSPVLPKDMEERQVLVLEARNMLALQLRRLGVIGG